MCEDKSLHRLPRCSSGRRGRYQHHRSDTTRPNYPQQAALTRGCEALAWLAVRRCSSTNLPHLILVWKFGPRDCGQTAPPELLPVSGLGRVLPLKRIRILSSSHRRRQGFGSCPQGGFGLCWVLPLKRIRILSSSHRRRQGFGSCPQGGFGLCPHRNHCGGAKLRHLDAR